MSTTAITEHSVTNGEHTTFYLSAGPIDGPPIIFLHGWPELSISWRHQLPVFAGLGFRAIAPDMRGYGRSTVYPIHADYAQREIVGDMLHLIDALGIERAFFVGHDWGSAVVWNLASHHPERCVGVANLCVPYYTLERGLESCLPLIDRTIYPEDAFPVGQWDYMRFYEENFAKATATFDADPHATAKALFRKGNPAGIGKPAITAQIRKAGGWFGGAAKAPDVPRDADVVSEEDLATYAAALARNSFFGPDSWYMNHAANAAYAAEAGNDGALDMPVLFLGARYDYICETVYSRLAEPMRHHCRSLTEHVIDSGHWMAQEKPLEVNAALAHFLATRVQGHWPVGN
jgi:soluble epoxide hydrolase / lipid-phosphate phosphatase